jgi:hypothetical protein
VRSGATGLLAAVVAAAILSLTSVAGAAVRCGFKMNPPLGGSYDAFNLPTPPGTYNVYYSFWSSPSPYYARRREADGTIRYESLRSNGGDWGLRELHQRSLHQRAAAHAAPELERRARLGLVDRGVEYDFDLQLLGRPR